MRSIYRYVLGAVLLCLAAFSTADIASAQSLLKEPLINRSGHPFHLDHLSSGVHDKCGPIDEKALEAFRVLAGDGWGYGYDRLLNDIEEWKKSPYVSYVRSIGKSVQGRDLWEMKITADRPQTRPRHTITIHARTHPHETQSWWVCEQVILFLHSDDPFAAALREQCTFYIIPMYNPDGVELETTRYNANGVDLEREWDKPNPQPEAAALKRRFGELMHSEEPIEIALNLHSSSKPERYFWFHDETGTSVEYAMLEREFIAGVRTFFARIMPWNYAVSWQESAPTHFPESWFWYNYGTDVMALTYEDVFEHDTGTSDAYFDSTALALLHGIADYLDLNRIAGVHDQPQEPAIGSLTVLSGPDPSILFSLPKGGEFALSVFDGLGREVTRLREGEVLSGEERVVWDTGDLPSGMYYVQLRTDEGMMTARVPVLR